MSSAAGKQGVLIIEGIHALNPHYTAKIAAQDKFRIYISPLTSLQVRRTTACMPSPTLSPTHPVPRGQLWPVVSVTCRPPLHCACRLPPAAPESRRARCWRLLHGSAGRLLAALELLLGPCVCDKEWTRRRAHRWMTRTRSSRRTTGCAGACAATTCFAATTLPRSFSLSPLPVFVLSVCAHVSMGTDAQGNVLDPVRQRGNVGTTHVSRAAPGLAAGKGCLVH